MKLPTTPKLPSARKQGAYLAALLTLGTACAFGQAVANQDSADQSATDKAAAEKAAAQKQKALSTDIKKASTSSDQASTSEEATIQMDPFVVETEKNQGYHASNTMGSRLNTKLDDVAASITVVTKDQLNDFALVDINDIFAMETNTQGTKTYTANSNTGTSSTEVDDVAVNRTTANRIRGLSNADIAIGNFAASNTVPIDSYNVDAVEISRGPNSSIFGTGGAGGGVNLVPASANLQKDFTKGTIMGSSYGTIRSTFDFNRPIFKNVLSFRVLGAITNEHFTRKPSYDKTRRTTFSTTFRPHKNTTIRASWEKIDEKYDRPNSYTPRDQVTAWKNAGSPSWDPTSNTYYYYNADGSVNKTGTVGLSYNSSSDPYATAMTGVAAPANGQVWVSTIGSLRVRPTLGISSGQESYFYPTYWGVNNISTTSTSQIGTNARELTGVRFASYFNVPAAYQSATALGYPSFGSTSDRNFYDYKNVNLAGTNFGHKYGETLRIELEQYFLQTEHHTIAAQIGAYKENITDYRRVFIGNGRDGVSYDIIPDVNVKLGDGSINPNYGAGYIGALAPKTYIYPIKTQTQKINLVYQLDLSHEHNWFLHALGRQRLLGYKEYNINESASQALYAVDQVSEPLTGYYASVNTAATNQTTAIVTGPTGMITAWNPAGSLKSGNNGNAVWNARYYVGDGSGRVTSGTKPFNYSSLSYHLYGNQTGYLTDPTTGLYQGSTTGANKFNSYIYTNATGPFSWYNINEKINTELTGSGKMQQSVYRTSGMVWQGFFLDDRIIPTIGARKDTLRTRDWNGLGTVTDIDPNTGFYGDISSAFKYGNQPWNVFNLANGSTEAKGITHTKGIVVKPFKWLSLSYNTSDSQRPQAYAIDLQGNPLPNPYGKTTDYGFTLYLLKNRLSLTAKKYKTVSQNARNATNVAFSRVILMDFDTSGDNSKHDLVDWYENELAASKNYVLGTDANIDAQLLAQTYNAVGISDDYISKLIAYNANIATTSDERSQGYEVELNYNPTRYWTMKIGAAETEAITDKIADTYQKYRDARMPIWTTITSPNDGSLYWTHYFNSDQATAQQYFYGNIENLAKLAYAMQGKAKPQLSKYTANLATSYQLAGITSNRFLRNVNVGTSIRWQSRQSIGFYGAAPEADGIVRSYDPNHPIYIGSKKYVDVFAGYNFRMFKDRIKSRLQLNISNVLEGGRLQPFAARPDGSIYGYRIVDPREYKLTWSFDL